MSSFLKTSTLAVLVALTMAIVLAVAGFLWIAAPNSVDVTIVNECPYDLSDVHVTHRHSAFAYLPSLGAGKSVNMTMRLYGGAGIRVSYFHTRGDLLVGEADIYVGDSDDEVVTIRIRETEICSEVLTTESPAYHAVWKLDAAKN